MDVTLLCHCCLRGAPDRAMTTPYSHLGKTETYADLLRDCFDINLVPVESGSSGICWACVGRLRDASNFKLQVQHSQEELLKASLHIEYDVKSEPADDIAADGDALDVLKEEPVVKSEIVDEEETSKFLHDQPVEESEIVDEEETSQELHDQPVEKSEIVYEEETSQELPQSVTGKWIKLNLQDLITDNGTDEQPVEIIEIVDEEETSQELPEDPVISLDSWDDVTSAGSSAADEQPIEKSEIVNFSGTRRGRDPKRANAPNIVRLSKFGCNETRKNLHNLCQILLYSNASPIKGQNKRGYLCAFCPKQFPEPHKLKKHFLVEHSDDKLIKRMAGIGGPLKSSVVNLDITFLNCALCDHYFETLQEFIVHLVDDHDKKLYTDVRNQLLFFKFETDELRCTICSVSYASFKLLQQHMNGHFRNYICHICNAVFPVERLLTMHLSRHADKNTECAICGKSFLSKEKLRDHVKRTHMGLNRNKCHFCNEKFVDYWKKVDHMVKEHGLPPVELKCQACDRTFNNQGTLYRHTRKYHLMKSKHQCPNCEMKFCNGSDLKKHLPNHTGVKDYKCEVCFKKYGRKKTLTEHMRIHADDRRFVCVDCGLAFMHNKSLKGHLRSKHGEVL